MCIVHPLDYLWCASVGYLLGYLLGYLRVISTDYMWIISADYLLDYLWCASVDYLRIIWGVTPKGVIYSYRLRGHPSDFSLEYPPSYTSVTLKFNS